MHGSRTTTANNNQTSRQHKSLNGERETGKEERTEERKSEEKVVRDREKKETGEETRKEKGGQVEEEEVEQVEKNVTGWTLVTRRAKQIRSVVRIFVKVDGMKTVAMEVSPEDKVQKIQNTVSGSDWDVYVTCEGRTLRKGDKLKSCGVRGGNTVQVTSRMRGVG